MSSSSDSMLQKKVGQLFAVGFHGLTPSPEIKTLIRDYGIGAVILFKRNIADAAQLQELTLVLQQEAKNAGHKHPLFIGIDQENGLVTRITPPIVAQLPGQMAVGATNSTANAYGVGLCTGEMLHFFGINMNYAPDCDVNSEPLNPVIGVRSPGSDPELVARISHSTSKGLRDMRVVPTVKHFPGHGDTKVDSHHGLPVIMKSRSELEKCELIPFRRAVNDGIEAVMTAHIALPQINSDPEAKNLPATLSPDALGILRNDLKYDGVIITDCLEMNGIRATYGTVEGSLMSLKAGSDSVMICHTYDVQVKSIERIVQAVQSGELPESRIEESLRRVTALKKRSLEWHRALRTTVKLPLDKLPSMNERHERFAKTVYAQSTTVIRNDSGILPISVNTSSRVLLLTPSGNISAGGAVDETGPKHRTYLDVIEEVAGRSASITQIEYPDTGILSEKQWKMIEEVADVVILVTRNAKQGQRELGLELAKRRNDLISIATCNPYDFLDDSESIKTYIATYEPTFEAFSSAIDVVVGKLTAKGRLPVTSKGASKSDDTYKISAFDELPGDSIIDGISKTWNSALPNYSIPIERMRKVINRPHGLYFIAQEKESGAVLGFCLAYLYSTQGQMSAQIALFATNPSKQGKGIGTRLLAETMDYLRNNRRIESSISLTSSFPRFWRGLPADLIPTAFKFFAHRGFRISEPRSGGSRISDLHRYLNTFTPPQDIFEKAAASGVTFRAITSEDYEGCLDGQKRNFSAYTGWVEAYTALNPEQHPSKIMAAFNQDGIQIGWTFMLSPEDDFVTDNWAWTPSSGGPTRTGFIDYIGVDASHRNRGVGLALLFHAIEDMKRRGIEAIKIADYMDMAGWFSRAGFFSSFPYRHAEI